MKRLEGKVAVVTGAPTGIGQAIAVRFAKEGAAVVVDYISEAANAATDKIKSFGGRVTAVRADVSDSEQVAQSIGESVKAFGKLDIVVNNAGIETKHDFLNFPLDEVRKIIDVNLVGPLMVVQAAARQMVKQGNGGRIINISSVHEDLPMPTDAPYCVSKGGLRMLTRTIAVELAKYKITVNNIGPDAIYTPIRNWVNVFY